jgi:hypothetical protein
MRGRTDFEDSLISVRREEQAQEKRRFQALNEALRARGLASDPEGRKFRAAQQKAIAERRAENARQALKPTRPSEAALADFSTTQLDAWDDAAKPSESSAHPSNGGWLTALIRRIARG